MTGFSFKFFAGKFVSLAKYLILLLIPVLFFSCVTYPDSEHGGIEKLSRNIYTEGKKTSVQLCNFFLIRCPSADRDRILRIAKIYVSEAKMEGINSDVAFVQMCLETNYLRYGNLVTPDMNNFCGLGAIDAERRGEYFPDEKTGIRAHIQHLHAYGTPDYVPLSNELVDRRYKYVNPRGKAPTVFELAGTWAADKEYGRKLDSLLNELAKVN